MLRLAKRESQFNPKATSHVGSKGLYQLTEITIRQIKELGFDGIDINMGCPDRNVEKQGGGAAMIKNPSLAQEVIDRAVQLHGGRGVLTTSTVAMLYEEIRALRIYEGASEIQKLLLARELLRHA